MKYLKLFLFIFIIPMILFNCKKDDIKESHIYINVHRDAVYSRDGRDIVFSAKINTKDAIIKYNLISKSIILLHYDKNYNWNPCYSNDGRKIAFTKIYEEKRYSEIFIMDSDGKNVEQITHENM